MMRHVLNLGLRLFLVCAVAAAGLGFTYTVVKDRIAQEEAKRRARAAEAVLSSIQAQPRESEELTALLQPAFPDLLTVFEGLDEAGRRAGYAFVLKSKGYNFITMAVGVDMEGKVTGIKAVSNEETPGLGAVALDSEEYLSNFQGKGPEPLTLKVDVDAWTGATFTSKGITNGVNKALEMWRKLQEGGED
ncbi:FMN-binding protein [Candidatus Solincola sp.]|nr:FMN-binding protein [Actinomycetota bacterium]MDI7252845.1 FMN-binding protein [Actinomycetota bacterium]